MLINTFFKILGILLIVWHSQHDLEIEGTTLAARAGIALRVRGLDATICFSKALIVASYPISTSILDVIQLPIIVEVFNCGFFFFQKLLILRAQKRKNEMNCPSSKFVEVFFIEFKNL